MSRGIGDTFAVLRANWNDFFFAPMPLHVCAVLRIAFGLLIFIDFAFLFPDVDKWFGPDGVLPLAASRLVVDPDTVTLFQLFPDSAFVVHALYMLVLVQALCLATGFYGRFQAACLFVFVTSFQHRNMPLFDAEDTVLRLACFFLTFMPVDAVFSLRNLLAPHRPRPVEPPPIWPLRLLQIEVTLIYLSTALLKFRGHDWIDGTALYYALQVEQFQRFPVPPALVENLALSRFATWAVLAIEFVLPFTLWIRKVRPFAIVAGILLHLAIDYAMNLFLFEWAMIAGLLAFLPLRSPPPRHVQNPVLS